MGTFDLDVHELAPDGSEGEALPGARVRVRRPGPGTVVAVLWASAAAGALVAPFVTLFGYRVTLRPDGTVGTQAFGAYDIDGWGRTSVVAARAPSLVGVQPPWYGVASYLGAGLLVAAIVALTAARSARWARRTGIVAGCVLAAVVVAEGLRIAALSAQVGEAASEPTVAVAARAGGCALIGAAAALCAVTGVIVSLRVRPGRSGQQEG